MVMISIPETREAIAQMFELYNMSGSPDDFKQLTDLDNTKAHILIRLSEPENDIIKSVKARISELTVNFPAEVSIGGYAIIMSDFAESIIKGQIFLTAFCSHYGLSASDNNLSNHLKED